MDDTIRTEKDNIGNFMFRSSAERTIRNYTDIKQCKFILAQAHDKGIILACRLVCL